MTPVGKIFVFLNLGFSFVVGALVVFAYAARTNWKASYDDLKKQFDVAQASSNTYRDELDKALNYKGGVDTTVGKALQDARNELRNTQAQLTQSNLELANLKKKADADNAALTAAKEQIALRQKEVKTLDEELKKSNDVNFKMVKERNEFRDQAVASENKSKSTQERNERLTTQVEELAKDLAKSKSIGAGGSELTARNPPTEDVEGLIKALDATSGLVTLTVGSDAGLTKGHTMEVFSLNPAKYKGTIRILNVSGSEAVGKPVSRPLGPIQVGDRVASKIVAGN